MRTTDAGHDLEAALAELIGGLGLGQGLGLGSVVELHDAFVNAEAWRGGFISVAADNDAAITVTDGLLVTSGFGAGMRREVPSVSLLHFNSASDPNFSGGQWAIIGDPNRLTENATITIAAGSSGTTTVAVAGSGANGGMEQYSFTDSSDVPSAG